MGWMRKGEPMKKKIVSLVLVGICLALLWPGAEVSAYQPDRAFIYDSDDIEVNAAVPSTNAYQVELIVNESVMGCTRLKEPQDIFVDNQDRTFILDSGNCRILILNSQYRCIRELKEFQYNGEVLTLGKGAQGLFYRESNGKLYIADTLNDRILVSDLEGNVSRIYEKPVDELLNPEVAYKPSKLIVDNMGIMYVVSSNVNTGALMIDSENNFLGFYGTNKIQETAAVALEYMWRSILTEEQVRQSTESFQPAQFNNIFWTEDRFVYAVSPLSEELESSVVKLNALGNNVFPKVIKFKEMETDKEVQMHLTDVTVDDEGVITVIDRVTARLFQYDADCNLLVAFGGVGFQEGLFTKPVALETNSESDLLVLDETKATLTVMQLTYYGEMIREANYLYNQGMHIESLDSWNEVIRMNANYYLAYVGMGKAYMSMGDYETAMECFKLGQDHEHYGEAKAAMRNEIIRDWFAVIAAAVVVGMVVILGYDFFKKKVVQIIIYIKKKRKGAEEI